MSKQLRLVASVQSRVFVDHRPRWQFCRSVDLKIPSPALYLQRTRAGNLRSDNHDLRGMIRALKEHLHGCHLGSTAPVVNIVAATPIGGGGGNGRSGRSLGQRIGGSVAAYPKGNSPPVRQPPRRVKASHQLVAVESEQQQAGAEGSSDN